MDLLVENTTDAATEKHVPVVERKDNKLKVSVGSVAHPMIDEHYIEWVELIVGERVFRTYLQPGESPEAIFSVMADGVIAREYCNLHGLWRTEA
jgi:superoxide reductase